MTAINSADQKTDTTQIGLTLAGKYLTFRLGNEEYGIPILIVNQIIRMQTITSIPKTPEFVRGMINLRGMIIPIVDLRRKFGMTLANDTDRTCIVVIQVEQNNQSIQMGIVIDEVREVREILAADIVETPSFGIGINIEFIIGVSKVDKSVAMLLDINKLLTGQELKSLKQMTNS